MAGTPPTHRGRDDARKRRTREHVIADLSLVHVEYFIANAGFTWEVASRDYGYDLSVVTFDREGYVEPGTILIQLKASTGLKLHADGENFIFDLDVRDYNLWVAEPNPVYLILYGASARRAYWLYFQRHVRENPTVRPRPGSKTVRIKVPVTNKVRTSFFRHARRLKQQAITRTGADHHG